MGNNTKKQQNAAVGLSAFVLPVIMLLAALILLFPAEKAYAAKASTLKIKMSAWPESIKAGKDFTLKGKVSSNYKLSSVEVFVYYENLDVKVYPKGKSTSIKSSSTINKKLDFGKLAPGEYTLAVTAVDVSGNVVCWTENFAVEGTKKKASAEQMKIYSEAAKNRKDFSKTFSSRTDEEIMEEIGKGMQSNSGYSHYVYFPNAADIILPEEIMEYYPELEGVEIIYEWCAVYSNAVRVCYDIMWDEYCEVRYGVRTGDWSRIENTGLSRDYKVYLKVKDVSESLGLSRMDTVEKIKAICDYIADTLEYDRQKVGKDRYSAWGALEDGYAVCSGYTDLFCWFAALNGIETIKVYGQNHVWNQVKVDGKWYNICTTNYDSHHKLDYFMVTNDMIHINDGFHIFRASSDYNECNDTTYVAYPYKDYICSSTEEVRAMFESQQGNDRYIVVVKTSEISSGQVWREYFAVSRCNHNYEGKFGRDIYTVYTFEPVKN